MSNPFYNVSTELITFLENHMQKAGCCAHDIAHVYRVAKLALKLAQDEFKEQEGSDSILSFQIIYLTGLLHDVIDSKLYKNELINEILNKIEYFLTNEVKLDNKGLPIKDENGNPVYLNKNDVEKIILIINSIGYKNLINPEFVKDNLPREYYYVQDSDLLDAIGSIGVARCMAFSGKLNRSLFGINDPDSLPPVGEKMNFDQYKNSQNNTYNNNTAVAHFFEKLLRIKYLLTTKVAIEIGEKRHKSMVTFLSLLEDELIEASDPTAGQINAILKDYI